MSKIIYSTDLEEEVTRAIREEIDKEILKKTIIAYRVSKGWTLVTVDESVEFANIEEWIEVNIRDEWRAYDNRWVFKDSQEALLFKMRWA